MLKIAKKQKMSFECTLIYITIKQVYILKKKVYQYLRQKFTHDCPSVREPGGQAESPQNVDILVNQIIC